LCRKTMSNCKHSLEEKQRMCAELQHVVEMMLSYLGTNELETRNQVMGTITHESEAMRGRYQALNMIYQALLIKHYLSNSDVGMAELSHAGTLDIYTSLSSAILSF
jgi:hypothetical protein